MRAARRRAQDSPPQGGSLLLNLSLFLMLLSFFIVLNNVSTYEETKYQPILDNLRTTFARTAQPDDGDSPSVTPDPMRSINEGETIDRIEALFRAQITGFQTTKAGSRGVMAVSVPLEEFDRAVSTPAQIDVTRNEYGGGLQTFFVPTLISLIQAQDQGTPYRMDMVFHTNDTPALLYNSDPRVLETARERSAGYAKALEDAGLSGDLLGVGVMQGDPASVLLIFRPREGRR